MNVTVRQTTGSGIGTNLATLQLHDGVLSCTTLALRVSTEAQRDLHSEGKADQVLTHRISTPASSPYLSS